MKQGQKSGEVYLRRWSQQEPEGYNKTTTRTTENAKQGMQVKRELEIETRERERDGNREDGKTLWKIENKSY